MVRPENFGVSVAEDGAVEKAAAFATTRCNELALAIQHILQGINLKPCAFMARALINHHNPIKSQF